MTQLLAAAVCVLLPLLALLLAPYAPWYALAPGLLAAAALAAGLHRRILLTRMGDLQSRVQDASLRLVNTNIQLLSLKELWRAMARPGQADQLLDTALAFCQRAAGFQEVLLLRVEPVSGELVGRWLSPGADGPAVRTVRWGMGGVGGAVARVLRSCHSLTGGGDASPPLLAINGDRVEIGSAAHGYLVVPLVSPLARDECRPDAWLYRQGCPSFTPASFTGPRRAPAARTGLDLSPCVSCRHYPVHGVLAVTDLGRSEGLRKSDQLTVESLAYAVGALLSNSALYDDVKAAERFRDHVLDGMTNGLITTDSSGRIVFANRQAAAMRGEAALAMQGRRLDELFDAPEGALPLRRALAPGAAVLHVEALLRRVTHGQGSTGNAEHGQGASSDAVHTQGAAGNVAQADERVPVRVSLSPFSPEQGGPQGVVCVFEDLSGLRAMQDEIRHLDTLAAIGRFASSMAHEIRNPLGGIGAGVGYLARSVHLGDEDRRNIGMIQREIERLDRTIRDLLGVARPSPLRLAATSPAELVRGAILGLSPWARQRGVGVLFCGREDLPEVHLDRDLAQQLLVNLIKNAVEASRSGDVVEVDVQPAEVTAAGSRRKEDQPTGPVDGIAVAVRDHGCGIAPADLARVFEPFYSKKSGGTGLGLFVCYSIVERHGGRIQVRSRPGEGSCFTVELPRFPALMGAGHEAEHSHR